MKLLNFFKKKRVETPLLPAKKAVSTYNIGNKNYAIEESTTIKVQSQAEDISVYGYSLECRGKYQDGTIHPHWFTYWNHRIYQTMSSAIDAGIKVASWTQYEYRVVPLYKMDVPQFRDYKIDKLLSDDMKPSKKYEIKAWKVKEDFELKSNGILNKFKKGTIYIQMESGYIMKTGNFRDKTEYRDRYQLYNILIPNNIVEEIDISNEKWIHPHLVKELKTKLKINK